jgi:hypothetical protein
MDYEEEYYGHRIRIVTTQDASGSWSATAESLDDPGVTSERHSFSSEAEARRAVLSEVYGALDRLRERVGKP